MSEYQNSSLWEKAFLSPKRDRYCAQRTYFREHYFSLRQKVAHLVAQIPKDIPDLTVHDVTHLDGLWETASTIAGPDYPMNPAEAYVFGAAILLHDAGMALVTYPGGIPEIYKTSEWRDRYAAHLREAGNDRPQSEAAGTISDSAHGKILGEVLRALHARQAERLPGLSWSDPREGSDYLIEDADLRTFYGTIIGRIAASHQLAVDRLREILQPSVGALSISPSTWTIEPLKLACLLRLADAAHIDERRAPRFLRLLIRPEGISEDHWNFQGKLAKVRLDGDALVLTSGPDFVLDDADAWWLCFDTVRMIDNELRACDVLLEDCVLRRFAAKRVRGAESPRALAVLVRSSGWEPVDTEVKVGDVPSLVRMLGGAHLYGENKTVPIRELIQNAADAIRARRLLEARPAEYGEVRMWVEQTAQDWWLIVEDDGVGMSVRTLTGALLDFGKSFWWSDAVQEEFPGLVAQGMKAIGRYGVGFFSVFMLGDVVRVSSRRYDASQDSTHTLEFRSGLYLRPILRRAKPSEYLRDGGTRVSVRFKQKPYEEGGLLASKRYGTDAHIELQDILPALCPNVDVNLQVGTKLARMPCVFANDWTELDGEELLRRIAGESRWDSAKRLSTYGKSLRPLIDDEGVVHGRACILGERYSWNHFGVITVGGFAAAGVHGIGGVLIGDPESAARDSAIPTVSDKLLAAWASEQATILGQSDLAGSEKLRAAGYIMQCGGDPGDLPIVERGGEYLGLRELIQVLREADSIHAWDDEEIEYDEDLDNCHPRDFKNEFRPDQSLVLVSKPPHRILTVHGQEWPALIVGEVGLRSYEQALRWALTEAWGEFDEDRDTAAVGKVISDEIEREVRIFARTSRY